MKRTVQAQGSTNIGNFALRAKVGQRGPLHVPNRFEWPEEAALAVAEGVLSQWYETIQQRKQRLGMEKFLLHKQNQAKRDLAEKKKDHRKTAIASIPLRFDAEENWTHPNLVQQCFRRGYTGHQGSKKSALFTLLEKWDTGEADDEMYAEWGGYEEMLKAQSESRDIPNRPTLRRLAKWDDEAHPTQPEIVVLTQPKIGDGVEQEEDLEESEADEDDEEEEGEDQREEPVRVGGMKRKRD